MWPLILFWIILGFIVLYRRLWPHVAYVLGQGRIRQMIERKFAESRSLPETPENCLFRMRQVAEVSEEFADFVAAWNRKYPHVKPRDCEWYRITAFKVRRAIGAFECGDCEQAGALWLDALRYMHEHKG